MMPRSRARKKSLLFRSYGIRDNVAIGARDFGIFAGCRDDEDGVSSSAVTGSLDIVQSCRT